MSSSRSVDPQEANSYSIGAVSHMTGIAEATLRVWERRYNFPRSVRTSGGHRKYSQRDVLSLHWVKLHVDAGMRTSRAIRAQSLTVRESAVAASLHEELPPCTAPTSEMVAIHSALLDALQAYDSARATAILDEACSLYPIASIVLDVIGPTLFAIGEAWSAGDANIAVEHFASNFLRHQLYTWMQSSPAPYTLNPIVLACAPGEAHEGSLLMIGVLLRRLLWPVIYLGQSLPLADIGALVNRIQPSMVVFVAMSETAALALAEWPLWLLQSSDQPGVAPPIIGYGGRAFTANPALADSVPGVLLGSSLCEGSQRVNRLMLHLAVLQN